jgi:hypothetical protein
VALAILFTLTTGSALNACVPPERPFLPASEEDIRAYADLIRQDFEAYIAAVQDYLRCIDEERARAFLEAQEVSEDYGRFTRIVE